jgi:hypothetical protein
MAEKNKTNWSDSLDDMLEKVTDGAFVNSSLNEFEKVVNDALKNQPSGSTTSSKSTADAYSAKAKTSYTETKPLINNMYESSDYASRYDQIDNCLHNITYPANYDSEKAAGHKAAVQQYSNLLPANQMDLRPVEEQLAADILTCQKKLVRPEPYLQGYYDALLLIRKVFYASKLARLQELSAMIKKR